MTSVSEQIKDRLPIVDVLGSYITLIPGGKSYKARCPFHNERTPSFSISPDRGLYYCFGCGAKGDIFTFVQEFEGVDFNGALKILADRAGIKLTSRDRRADDTTPVYEILEKATLRYQEELKKNSSVLEYLKNRGLTDETISRFRLGYAPDAWRFIADSCTNAEEQKIAARAGLIKLKDGSATDYYDRFRGRIMFPMADSSGRIVGFSGRMFPDTDEGPKYLNSPETEVFHKSRILYGLDAAKGPIRRAGFTILVEGQLDLLMSHQAGFKNTVATSGTAVSDQTLEDDHAALAMVSRLSPHLFLAFDGDEAGQKALMRAALVALKLGMNPKVVSVPKEADPADFLKTEGAAAWKNLLSISVHFLVHQARVIRIANLSPHQFVRALREQLFPYLSAVLSPVEQKLYIETIAKELGIAASDLAQEYTRYASEHPDARVPDAAPAEKNNDRISARERFSIFAERFPELSESYKEKLNTLSIADESYVFPEIDFERKPKLLALIERDFGAFSDDDRTALAAELYRGAAGEFFGELRNRLSAKLRQAEAVGDQDSEDAVLKKISALNDAWQAFA
jgi:DNA primase